MSTLTIAWSSATDPSVGWNFYEHDGSHYAYVGGIAPSERSTQLVNLNPGLVQVGISRVESVVINGQTKHVEGPINVANIVIPDSVPVPPGVTVILSIGP